MCCADGRSDHTRHPTRSTRKSAGGCGGDPTPSTVTSWPVVYPNPVNRVDAALRRIASDLVVLHVRWVLMRDSRCRYGPNPASPVTSMWSSRRRRSGYERLPGIFMPVATAGHLVAGQDAGHRLHMLVEATRDDLAQGRLHQPCRPRSLRRRPAHRREVHRHHNQPHEGAPPLACYHPAATMRPTVGGFGWCVATWLTVLNGTRGVGPATGRVGRTRYPVASTSSSWTAQGRDILVKHRMR